MKKHLTLAAVAATCILTGCFHEGLHELQSFDYDANVGYLTPVLQWDNPDDAGTAIRDLTVAVDGGALSYTKHFANAKEIASELLPFPKGGTLMAFANADAASGITLAGLPATKAGGACELSWQASQPLSQVWGAVATPDIPAHSVTAPAVSLQRILPTLTLRVTHVPAGTSINASVQSVARYIALSAADGGCAIAPGATAYEDISLGALSLSGDTATLTLTTFPTPSGAERTTLQLDVTASNGKTFICVLDAARIDCGKSYDLELDYPALAPYLYLDSQAISDWEEGWTVSGEILNPTEK